MGIKDEMDVSDERMPASRCPTSILNAIPSDCQTLCFANLKENEDFKNKAIVGRICRVNPIFKRANNGHIRKLLVMDALSEDENQLKLPVFLFDEFAKDSDAAELQGFIVVTDFILETSPRHNDDELPVKILVENEDSRVFIGRRVPVTDPAVESNAKQVKKRHCTGDTNGQAKPTKHKKDTKESENHIILSNHYEYLPLGDLQEDEKMTSNVYGIIDKCTLRVTQGKRTQVLEVSLTDETETGFTCSVFAAKDETFPNIYPGDIIRIHRMQVQRFRGRLKGKCISPRFILVFSKSNQGSKPRTTAKSFTFTDEDKLRVSQLFEWHNKKSEPKLISELKRDDYANIVCQVIGVYCSKTRDAVILKIWDGTKTNQFDSTHWGLKEENIDEKLFAIAKNYYVNLSVYGMYAATAGELRPGQFIEVRDAQLYSSKTNPDDSKLCLHNSTKEDRGIQVLNPDDDRVKKLKDRLAGIISDVQDIGNETNDLLSQNNSVFLNCDISAFTSSQASLGTQQGTASDFQARNRPLSTIEEDTSESSNNDIEILNQPLSNVENTTEPPNVVISVTDAAIKPGQSTQEFGEGMQQEVQRMEDQEGAMAVDSQLDPLLNKTPVEFRMYLHNPGSQNSLELIPFGSETDDHEWWSNIQTISVTDGHSEVKPSTVTEVLQREVPYKFRVFCVILSFKPETQLIKQLIHLFCPRCSYITKDAFPVIVPFEENDGLFYFYCPSCSSEKDERKSRPVLEYTYLVSFEVHDGMSSATVDVQLWKEEAVKFFKGITPEQALRDPTCSEAILKMLWTVCPNCRPIQPSSQHSTSYPILDCCIVSYSVEGKTVYRMFDTILL